MDYKNSGKPSNDAARTPRMIEFVSNLKVLGLCKTSLFFNELRTVDLYNTMTL